LLAMMPGDRACGRCCWKAEVAGEELCKEEGNDENEPERMKSRSGAKAHETNLRGAELGNLLVLGSESRGVGGNGVLIQSVKPDTIL
jgi:hypothetical protein